MLSDIKSTGGEHDGKIDLEIISGKFQGCVFNYDEVKFGEEENPDGTYTMHFEYNIVNDFEVQKSDKEEFNKFLGDTLINILEEQIAKSEVVYKGGIDEDAQSEGS